MGGKGGGRGEGEKGERRTRHSVPGTGIFGLRHRSGFQSDFQSLVDRSTIRPVSRSLTQPVPISRQAIRSYSLFASRLFGRLVGQCFGRYFR